MKNLKPQISETKLEKATRLIINNRLSGYDEPRLERFARDLAHGGCVSGMIGELVYNSDTTAFYKKHYDDINAELKETLDNYGSGASINEMFGDKWDPYDPLAFETNNQNLLAWFAFEETAFRLIRNAGIEI